MKGNQRKCLYLPVKQCEWLKILSEHTGKPESHFVKLALEQLIEMTGGYPEEWVLPKEEMLR